MPRLLTGFACFASVALLAASASAATAGGGTSIANAPLVVSGTPLTGNTSTDPTTPGEDGVGVSSGCWHDLEYFRLNLNAGDAAEITGGETDPANDFEISIFPPGTTDATIAKAKAVKSGFPRKHVLDFSAPSGGTYVLAIGPTCYDGVDGPFSFTVAVKKGVGTVKALVSFAGVKQVPASGSVMVAVRTPGGDPITDAGLVLKLYGTWQDASHLLGTAKPTDGLVKFTVHLPATLRGKSIGVQVVGSGTGYSPVKTRVFQRKVA